MGKVPVSTGESKQIMSAPWSGGTEGGRTGCLRELVIVEV